MKRLALQTHDIPSFGLEPVLRELFRRNDRVAILNNGALCGHRGVGSFQIDDGDVIPRKNVCLRWFTEGIFRSRGMQSLDRLQSGFLKRHVGVALFSVRGVGVRQLPICFAAHRLKEQLPPVVSLDLGGAAVRLCMRGHIRRQPTAFRTNARLEADRDRNTALRLQLGSFSDLVIQKFPREGFIAITHHHGAAVLAPIFPDELILIQAVALGVVAGSGHLALFRGQPGAAPGIVSRQSRVVARSHGCFRAKRNSSA